MSLRRLRHVFAFAVLAFALSLTSFVASDLQIQAGTLLVNGSFEEVEGETPAGWVYIERLFDQRSRAGPQRPSVGASYHSRVISGRRQTVDTRDGRRYVHAEWIHPK